MHENRGSLDGMTTENKCALVTGETAGFSQPAPAFCGVGEISSAAIISPSALARTWDPSVVASAAAHVGAAAAEAGYNVFGVPAAGVKRGESAGFSEDPYLAGRTAAAYVRGVQQTGVSACVRGYPLSLAGRSVTVDERALRELYITPTEMAVRAGARAVACGSGKLNGIEERRCVRFMTGVLRREWGFKGAAVCKVAGSKLANCALSAGIDFLLTQSPNVSGSSVAQAAANYNSLANKIPADKKALIAAVRAGEAVNPAVVNAAAERVADLAAASCRNDFRPDPQAPAAAAVASVVLLKNEKGTLPLAGGSRVALAGLPDAVAACDARIAENAGVTVVGSAGGFDAAAVKGACLLAEKADAVVAFVGIDAEGFTTLPEGQIDLLKALSATRARLIAVLACDRVLATDWDADCDALLLAGGLGARTAAAALTVVVGEAEPSGRLAETFPAAVRRLPKNTDSEGSEQYKESIFVGYRGYQKRGEAVKYPFGFGLSYASFSFSELTVGENGVTFYITNKGGRDGAAVAQMYVGMRGSALIRPVKELKGFVKVVVRAGETVRAFIPFDNYTFRYFNVVTGKWEIEAGEYELTVGASAADVALIGRKTLAGTGGKAPYAAEKLPSYAAGDVANVAKKEYDRLLAADVGIDLTAAKRTARRKKITAALIVAVALVAIDLIMTGVGLIPYFSGVVLVLIAVNVVVYGFALLIICAVGSTVIPAKTRAYLSPDCKEDNAYMIFPEKNEPDAAAEVTENAIDVAADSFASEDIKVPFAARAAAVNAYCDAEKVSVAELCARFASFAAARGLTVAPADARAIFAAMAGARLVVLKNAAPQVSVRLAETLNAFFGGRGVTAAAGAAITADDLLAAVAPAVRTAEPASITAVTLTDVAPDDFKCFERLLPFAQTPVRPLTLLTADGAVALGGGLWFFAVPAAGANYRAFPKNVASCAAAIEIAVTATAESADGGNNDAPISYDSWQGAVRAAKDAYFVREELWKKLDSLETWADGKAGFVIGNKLFLQTEDFTSVFMAGGGEDTEALDAAIAAKILPVLAAYAGAPFRDGENGLTETLDRLFGVDNIAVSQTAVKRLGLD